MPRAGFYNDNEYRAYPFIQKGAYVGTPLCPNSAIADCGFIMGLDSGYVADYDVIYLKKITRVGAQLSFEFSTSAIGAAQYPIVFTRDIHATEWETEFVESAINDQSGACAESPAWEGFMVSGVLNDLLELLPTDGTLNFYAPGSPTLSNSPDHTVEPARIQSLVKSHVRSLNVGNYKRIMIPDCTSSGSSSSSASVVDGQREIIVNATCITGDIQILGGLNCLVQQTVSDNKLTISARKGVNTEKDTANERCQYGSEIPKYPGEIPPTGSEFLSGGNACGDLITSIVGIGGPDVKIVAGTGIKIVQTGEHTLKIGLDDTTIGQSC